MRIVSAHHPCAPGPFLLAVHAVDDAFISAELATTGCWEPFETEVFARLVRAAAARHQRRRPLVVDGGANLGWYSVVAGLLGADVIAAEPMPANADLLDHNVTTNGLDDRVRVERAALGAEEGIATLHLSSSNQGDHRLHVGTTADPAKRKQTVEVRVTRLDTLLGGSRPDVIKLDTQGSEVAILQGAMTAWGPGASDDTSLLTEFWPYGLSRCGSSAADLLAVLAPCIGTTHECFVVLESSSALVPVDAASLRRLAEATALAQHVRGFVNLALIPVAQTGVLIDLIDLAKPVPFL